MDTAIVILVPLSADENLPTFVGTVGRTVGVKHSGLSAIASCRLAKNSATASLQKPFERWLRLTQRQIGMLLHEPIVRIFLLAVLDLLQLAGKSMPIFSP